MLDRGRGGAAHHGVLHTELPFLPGVSLRDFSRITVEEFGSFVADFLRLTLPGLDDALNDVQSEREMVKVGLRINDEMRAMRAEMVKAQRKRALSAGGAVLGVALLAVYGPALAIAELGVSGGPKRWAADRIFGWGVRSCASWG